MHSIAGYYFTEVILLKILLPSSPSLVKYELFGQENLSGATLS